MKPNIIRPLLMLTFSIVAFPVSTVLAQRDLNGTSWQLVKFQGGSESIEVPANDRFKYTITFGSNGRATVRVDSNRGTGGNIKGRTRSNFSPWT